jgi:hypothetical protein
MLGYCCLVDVVLQDEVPAALMDAHFKNVEASSTDGKFDPSAGLAQVCLLLTFLSFYYCGLYSQGLVPRRDKSFLFATMSKLLLSFLSHPSCFITLSQGSRNTI